ncbi:MAG: hypothetical protein AB7O57_19895, partial [Hyphomicrobiaceae bacterium]
MAGAVRIGSPIARARASRWAWPSLRLAEAVAAAGALLLLAGQVWLGDPQGAVSGRHTEPEDQRAAQLARRAAIADEVRYRGGETLTAAYGGAQYTYPSDVRLARPGTDLTIHAVPWEGRPFEHPVYYGVRVAKWPRGSVLGSMVDFTHSKVYSPMEETVRFSGHRNGSALPAAATVEDVFHKLEFTHGHNMLTLNGLMRLPVALSFFSPYVGAGVGVSLPHTEVQLNHEHKRTYEYQYTGPAFQVVLGVEMRIPHLSYFV